ncbi:asparaginase [Corynebacterium falsenii DSM 44353]|nr:asparaginase [Corynebacterium falsenii DSM 44353]
MRVLGTGGTISCTHDAAGALVPTLDTAALVRQADCDRGDIIAEDVMSLDSSSITLAQIDELLDHIEAAQRTSRAVVVLHGTDTMEETLMAAHLLLPPAVSSVSSVPAGSSVPPVPIVFTGAQRPADDPHPDGPANISGAINLATELATKLATELTTARAASGTSGVFLHFGGRTLAAAGTYKFHTTDDDAFRSSSPHPAGVALGGAPLRTQGPRPRLQGRTVPIITTYAGDDGRQLTALSARLEAEPIDGLVIAALGSGNLPLPVADALRELQATHPSLPVVLSTRVPEGSVHAVYGGAGGGASLVEGSDGALSLAGFLSPAQARIQLLANAAAADTTESAESAESAGASR